jgi:hypothetical protein
VSELVGSVCRVIGAVAVGLGVASAGFAGTLMSRYQPRVIAASLLVMAGWLAWDLRRARTGAPAVRWGLGGLRVAARTLVPQATVMGAVYAGTLLVTAMVSGLVTR